MGQRVYIEKHEMFLGHPRNEKFQPNNVINIDGPSFVHYGKIAKVDEDGWCTAVITTKIEMDGKEIPFVPSISSYDDIFGFDSKNDSLLLSVYTDKEKCQNYCNNRNQTQMNNWCKMRPTDYQKEKWLDDVMIQMTENMKTETQEQEESLTLTDEDLAGIEFNDCLNK